MIPTSFAANDPEPCVVTLNRIRRAVTVDGNVITAQASAVLSTVRRTTHDDDVENFVSTVNFAGPTVFHNTFTADTACAYVMSIW